jgi:hypothetical protein
LAGTVLANSAYDPLPADAPARLRKLAGSYYLVTLAVDEIPTLLVAVSVHATDVGVEGGQLIMPARYGPEFRLGGIDATGRGRPMPAELAVATVSIGTGALVSSVPTFHSHGIAWSPRIGYWRVPLDRSIRLVSRKGEETSTDVAFVEYDGSTQAAPYYPPEQQVVQARVDDHQRPGATMSMTLTPRQ